MKTIVNTLIAAILLLTFSTSHAQTLTLKEKIKRFAPAKITGDASKLSSGDKKALAKLVAACAYMDSIYLRQVWTGNIATLTKLRRAKTEAEKDQLRYFLINMSPWSNLDNDEAFIEGVPPRPEGANYYPDEMPKEALELWITSLQEKLKTEATGYFWTIRINEDGRYVMVPYSEEYAQFLTPAAKLLKEAAALTTNASLKNFLNKRADAFKSNDYYDSDVAWMELDSPIEPTIGPYEVYMDKFFNYKAAFEAFITIRNEAETKKLAKYSSYLQEIENNLPIDAGYRNPKLGAMSPIRVVDEVATGGESRPAVQTAAFNLPNDERVVEAKGSKKVMLKNVQEAKFKNVLKPIASIAVEKAQLSMIDFEMFFTHILCHELMHGLGPQVIKVNGEETTVRKQMKELGSAMEEAKADISGLFALQYLINKGVLPKSAEAKVYVTYLASVFRSVRFGLNEAHGKGIALQFNYLCDEGAFPFDPATATFSVHLAKIKPAVEKLTREIMTIQAEGSYDKAKALLEKYCILRPDMKTVLDKMGKIPVDILPQFSAVK